MTKVDLLSFFNELKMIERVRKVHIQQKNVLVIFFTMQYKENFGKWKIVTKGIVVHTMCSSSIWDHLKNKQQESFLDIPDVPNGSPETCSTCQLVYDLTNLYLHTFMYLLCIFIRVILCFSNICF